MNKNNNDNNKDILKFNCVVILSYVKQTLYENAVTDRC